MRHFFAKALVVPVYLLLVLLFLVASLSLNARQSQPSLRQRNATPRLDPLLLHMKSETPSIEKTSAALAEQHEIELRLEVQRLYALSSELKDEVNASDSRAFLNTALLRRLQDIEKLAKQIRDRARR